MIWTLQFLLTVPYLPDPLAQEFNGIQNEVFTEKVFQEINLLINTIHFNFWG